MNTLLNAVAPVAGLVNRARLGFPERLFQGAGRIGDDLLCSTVFHELKRRGEHNLVMQTSNPGLFEKNPDVDRMVHANRQWSAAGLAFQKLAYYGYEPDRDADLPPPDHILIKMCELARISGKVELRPYLYLTEAEFAAGRIAENQVAMQTSGLAALHPMLNKEWYPHRFQELNAQLRTDVKVIQLGSPSDLKLEGAVDMRGRTTYRQAAAILANSLVFIGLAGFLMHLARAVDCRSVILYGGREKPEQTGYLANKNLYHQVRCAPCWQRCTCDFNRKCMDMITVRDVLTATAEQISRYGSELEVQTAEI